MASPKRVATNKDEVSARRVASAGKAKSPSSASQTATNANRLAPGVVGARLRARRVAKGISLRQFARDLDVSASFISQLETGKAQPSVATFFSICAALGTSIDEFFDGDTAAEVIGKSEELTDASNNEWRTVDKVASVSSRNGKHEETGSTPVVHPNQRRVLVLDSGVTWESLIATHHEKADFMFVRYDVGGSSTLEGRLIRHVGTEYGFIIKGTLEIALGFEIYVLTAGDSISFDSSRPHRLTNVGDVPVEAIWVNLEYHLS
jgi:transcriptional regulator with XRE-family HTH domain